MNIMKRNLCTFAMIFLLAVGFAVCSLNTAFAQSDPAEETEQSNSREGFSAWEISDELFERMKSGRTYKEDCIKMSRSAIIFCGGRPGFCLL